MKLKTMALISSAICLASASVYAGNEAGGGGKDIELEFAEIAYIFADTLSAQREAFPDFSDMDLDAFLNAQANTEVYAVDSLCFSIQTPGIGGTGVRCLDAEYLPETRQIRFSTEAWQKKNCIRKMGIVVHEFGRAAGIENGNYKYSARVSRNEILRNACSQYEQQAAR